MRATPISMLEISLAVIGLLLYTSRADYGSIASSTSGNTDIQVYFQDSTGRLQYRLALAGVWQNDPQVISVTDQPKANTPLTGVAWQDSNNLNLRLYYLDLNSEIIEASAACSGSVCQWSSSTLLGTPVSTSGLAAAWLGSSQGIRVFYLNSSSYIYQLDSNTNWSSLVVGPQAYASSSLALSVPTGTLDLQVYYLSTEMALSLIEFGNVWSPGIIIQDSSFEPNVSFAAVAQTTPSTRSLYYISETKGVNELQYQNGAWLGTAQSLSSVLEADTVSGPIGAVAWTSSIKLYYVSDGDIVEEKSNGNNQWTLGSYSTPNTTSTSTAKPTSTAASEALTTSTAALGALKTSTAASGALNLSPAEIAGIIAGGIFCILFAVSLMLYFTYPPFQNAVHGYISQNATP